MSPRLPTIPRANVPRAPRQLTPSGSFKLPELKLPQSRLPLFIVAGIVFVILGVVLLGELRNRAPEAGPNAIWLFDEWTYARRSDDAIAELVQQLRDNRIGTIYAWVSYLRTDGSWAGNQGGRFDDIADDVQAFVVQLKRAYPEAQVLAWIGLPSGTNPQTYAMEPTVWAQTISDFSERSITQMGFDGVFLHADQVVTGDENYMDLLRLLRLNLGEGATIGVAVPPDWTPTDANITLPPLYAPGTLWTEDYKQRVALIADQIAVMAYNSGFTDAEDYINWVAYQTRVYAETVAALDGAAQIIIGVSTGSADLPRHDPTVENIETAAAGVRQGIAEAESAALSIRGIALYFSQTIDPEEWTQFRDHWLR
ncbi:MAG: hypothetical protein U0694_19965 [Anaerolineae bacterium]